jgi:hypothetical protein
LYNFFIYNEKDKGKIRMSKYKDLIEKAKSDEYIKVWNNWGFLQILDINTEWLENEFYYLIHKKDSEVLNFYIKKINEMYDYMLIDSYIVFSLKDKDNFHNLDEQNFLETYDEKLTYKIVVIDNKECGINIRNILYFTILKDSIYFIYTKKDKEENGLGSLISKESNLIQFEYLEEIRKLNFNRDINKGFIPTWNFN